MPNEKKQLKDIENKIKNIDKQAKQITSKKYTNQKDLDLANEKLTQLNKKRTSLYDNYTSVVGEINQASQKEMNSLVNTFESKRERFKTLYDKTKKYEEIGLNIPFSSK